MNVLIPILLVVILAWLVLVRPQRRRQAAQEDMFESLRAGDEIVTAGGLYGTIHALRDDVVEVEIAPGTTVRVARRAVAAKIEQEDEEEPEEQEPEAAIPENDG